MTPIQLDDKTARQLYFTSTTPVEFKVMLEETFGKNFFSKEPMDYIKTLQDAIDATGETLVINATDAPDEIAYKKLKIIYKALNNDPKFPDYSNHNQSKYYPFVKPNLSGLGLSCSVYGYTYSTTDVGSRLVLNRRELCEYVAKQFNEILAAYIF